MPLINSCFLQRILLKRLTVELSSSWILSNTVESAIANAYQSTYTHTGKQKELHIRLFLGLQRQWYAHFFSFWGRAIILDKVVDPLELFGTDFEILSRLCLYVHTQCPHSHSHFAWTAQASLSLLLCWPLEQNSLLCVCVRFNDVLRRLSNPHE